ncbi:GGDEF domain-containing protein [Pseudomonas sp. G11-1]|uniref:GGDEF domain-containing protein n=1 Tax=Halopseudomonas sp. SMJS2 TaxID=3041098 RepID=UPI0024529506|nr:GGDEF domain-containing protein [Halopseudomonas sp. SMJS2]MCO5786814.1 GGDEF domain-containing protein [Pseudomonas sp. G11-1]MCO5790040.1 GGDEF domain-containing protein [Pseudomonas sp. G11-2]WGK61815.1 GGDEF domain-containing protein [Halopseudomonas sp. SMJS2]
MTSMLAMHRFKLTGLLITANTGLLLHLLAGEIKPVADWDWLDIAGEGGSALLLLTWLGLLLKSRPAGYVTNLLFMGLACLFFSLFMDTVDEFVALPDAVTWDGWLESGPMPIGFILMTLGIFHWHQEQLAINEQMRNRERVFREHRQFDKLTPLGDANYLRAQLQLTLADAAAQQQPVSLIMLDMNAFSRVNREYGYAEGDRLLQVLTQLMLLNLRTHDLLCRLAGDRFVIILPHTGERQAQILAEELEQAVRSLAYKSRAQGERLELSASVVALMARDEDPATLLERMNITMARAKQNLTVRYG